MFFELLRVLLKHYSYITQGAQRDTVMASKGGVEIQEGGYLYT